MQVGANFKAGKTIPSFFQRQSQPLLLDVLAQIEPAHVLPADLSDDFGTDQNLFVQRNTRRRQAHRITSGFDQTGFIRCFFFN
jgi:hypothetical protein